MSDKMPSSWKYLSNVKGYLRRQDFKQAIPEALQNRLSPWKEWAGQKISSSNTKPGGQERLALFPGWAARRYYPGSQQPEAFGVDIFVSGFATVHKAPEMASRSQRAFLRLAKGFAALPKLEGDPNPPDPLVSSQPVSKSTEQLLSTMKLPPRPTEISEDYQIEALERHLRQLSTDSQNSSDASDSEVDSTPPTPASFPDPSTAMTATLPGNLRKLHANLEARLLPFWSSVLPNRQVRIKIFAADTSQDDSSRRPVCSQEVRTGTDGSFECKVRLSWEQLCQHPEALNIAFGDHKTEHEFLVVAEIVPLASPQSSAASSLLDVRDAPSRPQTPRLSRNTPAQPISTRIPLTHAPLRVISDIDDTVKHSNVIGGARAVFHNVFVKELSDLVIPGVGDWYTNMWKRDVRFHYVSNGPFEYLPVLAEFFQIANLPPGSLKLKSYAGRSLFTGLLSAPAARKRAGVLEILESFPHSRFILIGDSGEQDLELYADLARERGQQITGVFIRHVDDEPLEDPTGRGVMNGVPLRSAPPGISFESDIPNAPRPKRSLTDSSTPRISTPSSQPLSPSARPRSEYFTPSHFTSEPEEITIEVETPKLTQAPRLSGRFSRTNSTVSSLAPNKSGSTGSTSTAKSRLSESEKRRFDLQTRVYRARMIIPPQIPFRVFKTPEECTEIHDILSNIVKQ